jgi:hypothetical protein
MSLQQALEVVKLQHAFWHKELCRAHDEELEDCEFFRRQCQREISELESELGIPATHRTRSHVPRKPPERRLSTARPATTRTPGRATAGEGAGSTSTRKSH